MTPPKQPEKLSKLGRAALWYAVEKEWRVFPLHTVHEHACSCGEAACGSPGKHPRTENGCHDATTEAAKIRAWWGRWPDANVGVATGGGLVVIDIDPLHGGNDTFDDLRRTLANLPDTPEVLTGGGGRHIYLGASVEVRNSQGTLGAGVDVRGEGGYVVAPPSLHESGRSYVWEASSRPEEVDVAAVPDAWLAAMTKRTKQRSLPGGAGETIHGGSRNTTLFKRAASMRAADFEFAEIEAALQTMNETRCAPPLDPAEVKGIALSACRYPPGRSPEYRTKRAENDPKAAPTSTLSREAAPEDEEPFARGDSVEIAERLLWQMERESQHPIVFDRGTFWQYDRAHGVFIERDRAALCRHVSTYAGLPKRTEKGTKGLALSDAAIKGAVNVAATQAVASGFFNAAARGIAFTNAFVTVERGEVKIKDLSHEWRAQHALAVPYEGLVPTPRWTGMLREVFRRQKTDETGAVTGLDADDTEACVQLLQEFAGAAIMGEATTYAACLILVGPGNDGKSRVLNVLRALFPATAVCSIPPQSWGRTFLLADLAGKRLNVVSELPERDILDAERFKAVVAGDPLQAERKYADPFTLTCEAAHLFACNELPATKDQSKGFWRRFAVIPCTRQFKPDEEVKNIDRLVIAEELAGVAAWAIEGAARLQRNGAYTVPPSVAAAKEEWQRDSDQVRQWVEQCCDVLPEGTLSCEESTGAELYVSYKRWTASAGHTALAQNRLASRLKGLGLEHRTKAARFYRLKLRTATAQRDPDRWSWMDTGSGR